MDLVLLELAAHADKRLAQARAKRRGCRRRRCRRSCTPALELT